MADEWRAGRLLCPAWTGLSISNCAHFSMDALKSFIRARREGRKAATTVAVPSNFRNFHRVDMFNIILSPEDEEWLTNNIRNFTLEQ
ncbi:hypothetical protein HYDPIDRAFT_111393 [Hydnomerulius pinastri MD-312]|uniref:Uncharacterized protein n=1 Tax=Hydnomerulius pinastri MD-312 TaxID=994086 RepID=A0A0C9VGS9_9AGAM|nr:hypothetical protein HYDPIDRAFT_111393 [Hydnomerulius pinastri MD-312]